MAALLLALGPVVPVAADQLPNPPDPTAVLDIEKTASAAEVGPGDTLVYTIEVGCSAISDVGCRGAITTDAIPEPFVIDSVTPSGPNDAAEPEVAGQNVTVTWIEDIGAGATGMLDNTTSQVAISVHVPEDVSYDFNGVTVANQALAEATNATDVPASVDVTINVPLDLATSATKTFTPDTALAAAGTPVTAALTGTNDSNATVDTLVIQDPTDPTATPNPFTYLGFTGFGAVTAPEGATATTYEVYVDGAWVEAPGGDLPAGVDPADVQGARVTFTGAIPPGATGSVDLDLETTVDAAAVPETTTITNNVQSAVTLDGETATGPASDTFTLQANTVEVTASKSFDPDLVIAGEPSTVTLGGRNDSPLMIDSMTITEPSSGTFPPEYTFGGFTGGITYPAGATSGTVTFNFSDGTSSDPISFPDGGTPAVPAGHDPADVTSFTIEFNGEIQAGAEATVPFQVNTDPDLDPADLPTTVNNEVQVEGTNDNVTDDATASDDLFIYDEVIEPYIDKQVRPSQIIANPGEFVTVSLQGGTTERPDPPETPTGTTGNADQIVIQDPLDPVEPDPWWNAFDLASITQTPIPADSTLTVYYWDTTTDEWVLLDGPVAGPDIYSFDVPDDVSAVAGGIRFVYDYVPGPDDGFAPGTDLAPNFTSTLRVEGRYDGATPPYNTDPAQPNTLIPDCAQSSATSPTPDVPDGSAAMEPADCPEIEIIPIGGGGGGGGVGDLIDKAFGTSSSDGEKSVIARSGDTIPSTLSWSTGGYSGFERVEITDVPDPTTDVADSVYDAFNVIRVNAIGAEQDPFLTYDEITGVQLWNGTAWVDAANDPCPAACDGTFPGMDLTAAEQESTLAVRLVFAESPTRGDRTQGDLDAPPVGSGVARSIGNTRHVTLVWQVRDTQRSDGSPALGEDTYNLTDPGVVRNTIAATGFPADGDPISDQAQDDVVIIDVPITTTTQKDWLGGPVAVPSLGTPLDQYPRTRLRITTTNTTPARVDQMQITEPAPGSTTDPLTDPFDYFTLVRIAGITEPPGTESTAVSLSCPDGSTFTYDRAQALALAAMPCDVVGVQVLFDGRIASGADGVVALDVRLRAVNRETLEPITPADSPITNTAEGVVADIDAIQDCPPPDDARYACDQDTATIEVVAPTFGINAGKSISPATQTEGDFSPVTVTVSAQNSGSARPFVDTITDDDPTFWNAVDFIGMDPSWTLPAPVQFVQACYLSGGDFTAGNVEADTLGGDFTCQEIPGGLPPDPGTMTLEEARAFINDAAADVDIHGLRFNFMAGDEVGWQNPANPLIQVPFQVERRVDLRTGGPVPTTRSDQAAAPGEQDAGIFVDTVEVAGQSVLVGPDTRLTADDTADAPYTHDHLTVGVEVDKQPSGEVQPGQVIPFTLTYTNTGESPLTNPVFTDVLPSDADGNQLIFDPDSDPTINSPYGFALAGAAPSPPNGDPLPTDEDDITISPAGDTLTFEMPEGSVLEPGQTYTITIDLMLRPGLTPDDLVTNTDTVIADEPFDPDACSPNYDAATGECWDDTTVSPVSVAALSTVKKVKADVPVIEPGIPEIYLDRDVLPAGSDVPDDYCDTAADVDGFYRAPCIPVTYPGDTETWRFTVTNAGTLPLTELVSIDALPIPGDTGVIVTLPRESEWEPTFADNIELISGNATADMSVFYTPSHTPCIDDLDPLGPQCPAGEWLPYDDTVANSEVGSLKFQIDFGGDLFDPGEQLTLQFQTRTTPDQLADSTFPIAWNTVATGGVSDDGAGGIGTLALDTVTATEGRKVGVTYPTGPIQLQKVVSGDGAPYAPDSFTVRLTCTVNGEEMVDLPEVTLTPGDDPTQIDGLPWGAECTATEADQGQTSEVIGTATVGGPEDDIGLVTVENVFDLGDLSVTKAITSDAVDQDGNPITYGPFQVAATCEFLGEEVWADGYDATNPMQTEIGQLSDGLSQIWVLTGLPVGAECTITEPDPADAADVTITPETVEVALDEVVQVDVENHYDVGSLHLRKLVAPPAVEEFPISQGPFTLHVDCTLTDASHPDGEIVYEDDIVLQGPQPLEATIDNIAAGASCTVTEPDPGAATAHIITPGTVEIEADDTVNIVATNLFGRGALTVTKTVDGPGAERYGAGPFEVTLSCTYTNAAGQQVPLATPGGSTRELSADNDYTATYEPLLFGSTCQIAETQTGGATGSVITDAEGQEVSEITIDSLTQDLQLSVTNTFDVGAIKVTKTVVGDGPGRFEVELACSQDVDGTRTQVDIPGGAERALVRDRGFTATYDDLPVGAECTLVETDDGGARSTTITPNDGDPEVGAVTVQDGQTLEIDVVNEFDPDLGPASADEGGGLPGTGAARGLLGLAILGLVVLGIGTVLLRRSRRSLD
jgi:uncharacterized repeat protein (TIGR01451 family)